jgi:glutathione S-transferase
VETVCDFVEGIYDIAIPLLINGPAEKLEEYMAGDLINALKRIEARLLASGGDYFVGTTVTIADLYVFSFVYDWFMRKGRKD